MRTILFLLLLLQAGVFHAQDTLHLPAHTLPAPIKDGEYFFDTDPGFGSGNHFDETIGGTTLSFISTGSIAALSQGVHKLNIRIRDTMGTWGITNSRFLYIIDPSFSLSAQAGAGPIEKFEFFLDADPGIGNGVVSVIPASLNAELINIPVDISGLATGVHTVNVRFQDTSGIWSLTTGNKIALVSVDIDLPPNQVSDSITTMEYFFDEDPGTGNGILITVPATANLENYVFTANISMLSDGTHRLFMRTLTGPSLTAMYSFSIGDPLGLELVSFSVKQKDNDALLSWHTEDEAGVDGFVLESSTDGKTFSPFDLLSARNQHSSVYTRVDEGISRYNAGKIYYRLKIIEENGGYTYAPVVSLYLEGRESLAYPNPFLDDFNIIPGDRFRGGVVIIRILDISGRCIYKRSLPAGQGGLRVSPGALQPGNYLLSVESDSYKEVLPLTRK